MNPILFRFVFFALLAATACSNPANKRAISLDKLNDIQAEDSSALEHLAPQRDRLSAAELIALSECTSLSCIQLYMKSLSDDFIYGQKGEFYAAMRITIKDTSGNTLTIPASTYYIDVNPQAPWRAAHTVHTSAQAEGLMNEFSSLGFRLAGEGYYLGIKSKQQQYISEQFPGKNLYVTATFRPWHLKGLYENKVTWLCYVFEVYEEN